MINSFFMLLFSFRMININQDQISIFLYKIEQKLWKIALFELIVAIMQH